MLLTGMIPDYLLVPGQNSKPTPGQMFVALSPKGIHTRCSLFSFQVTVEVSNAVSAAVDAIIATSMIYYLYRGQSGQERSVSFPLLALAYII